MFCTVECSVLKENTLFTGLSRLYSKSVPHVVRMLKKRYVFHFSVKKSVQKNTCFKMSKKQNADFVKKTDLDLHQKKYVFCAHVDSSTNPT